MRDERDVIQPELAAFSVRMSAARVLGEQQLWEAAKAVAPSLFEGHTEVPRGRLAALMDAHAMVDGVMFLADFVEPIRSVSSLDHFVGRWRCTIRCERCCDTRQSMPIWRRRRCARIRIDVANLHALRPQAGGRVRT